MPAVCATPTCTSRTACFGLQFPRVFGHEPVGEIVEVGAGVSRRKVGDRVGVGWSRKAVDAASGVCAARKSCARTAISTGISTQGSHAEYMLAFADATMLIPDALSLRAGCADFLRRIYSVERVAPR